MPLRALSSGLASEPHVQCHEKILAVQLQNTLLPQHDMKCLPLSRHPHMHAHIHTRALELPETGEC